MFVTLPNLIGVLFAGIGFKILVDSIRNSIDSLIDVEITCKQVKHDTRTIINPDGKEDRMLDALGDELHELSLQHVGKNYVSASVKLVVWEYEYRGKLYTVEEMLSEDVMFQQGDVAIGYVKEDAPEVMIREPVSGNHFAVALTMIVMGILFIVVA